MKKRLFLTVLVVAALLCIFAVSISATTINKDTKVTLSGDFTIGEETVTNPQVNLYDSDGDALIWYLDVDKKLVSDKIANVVSVSEDGIISFKSQTQFYKSSTRNGVVVVNLRDNVKVSGTDIDFDGQIKHFDPSKAQNAQDNFSHGFQFGGYSFSTSDSYLQYFYFPITAESIGPRMFQKTSIIVADILPGTPISKVGAMAFYYAINLKEIFIPNDIETLYISQDGGLFEGCNSLESVVFEENSRLENAGYGTFWNCYSLKELYLPNSVKTIGRHFVRGASNLEVFSFGASFEYFTMFGNEPDSSHMWVFYGCNKLKRVYMPATFALLDDEYAFNDYVAKDDRLDTFDRAFSNAGSFTLYFTGTKEEIETLKTRISYTEENQSLANALNKVYSYDEYVAAGSPEGSMCVYGLNTCETFYGGKHNLTVAEGNTCSGVCDREGCGLFELVENPIHTNEWIFNGGKAISYTTAFTAEHICKFCQTVEDSQTIGVILYSDGISYDEKDYTGVYEQIKVNKIALETYATLSGQEFDYGIFALAAGEAETSAPIAKGQDGKATADDKTVYASFTGTEYTYLRIKITGLSNGSSIFCGAYLIIGDNVIYVSNKQEGTEVAKYTMVTKTPQA